MQMFVGNVIPVSCYLFVLSNPERTAVQICIGRNVLSVFPLEMVYFERHANRGKALRQRHEYAHLPPLLMWAKIRRCNPKLSALCAPRPGVLQI